MKKTDIFNGLLDYKKEKTKPVKISKYKVSGIGSKAKAFAKRKEARIDPPSDKVHNFSKVVITNPAKHASGYF